MGVEGSVTGAKLYAQEIAALPEPPGTFRTRDSPLTRLDVLLLKERGILLCQSESPDHRPHLWSVHPRWYEMAVEHAAQLTTFPCCGGTGFRNDAGTLRCRDCGAEVTREQAAEVTA